MAKIRRKNRESFFAKESEREQERERKHEKERERDTKIDSPQSKVIRLFFDGLRMIVHIIAAVQFIIGIYYYYFRVRWPKSHINERFNGQWGGKFRYLTFLNMILQTLYYLLALSNDIFGSNKITCKPSSKLRRMRDYVFATWAFPLAQNVCVSFWVVYAFDRELIFPAELDEIFPRWLNHVVHTNVVLLCILDMFTCFRNYPNRFSCIVGNAVAMVLYIIWIHIIYYQTGDWVYPILDILNIPLRYMMLIGMIGFTLAFYFLGEHLNRVVWSKEFKQLQRSKKRWINSFLKTAPTIHMYISNT